MELSRTQLQRIERAMNTSNNRGLDEYEWSDDPDTVAESRGLIVIMPEPNQIQLDIDSDEQMQEFERRYWGIETSWGEHKVETKPSASGMPHRHVTITFKDRTFTSEQRLMLQAGLNDDPIRVFLNMMRYENGVENPSRLFERPEGAQETQDELDLDDCI